MNTNNPFAWAAEVAAFLLFAIIMLSGLALALLICGVIWLARLFSPERAQPVVRERRRVTRQFRPQEEPKYMREAVEIVEKAGFR